MGRGSNLAEGISIDEGLSEHGVRTVLHFRGDTLVIERQQDMDEVLRHVALMRARNEGKRWGEGREVGHIPELFYTKIRLIRDRKERDRAVKEFFRENPAFCAYEPYLREFGRKRASPAAAPVAMLPPKQLAPVGQIVSDRGLPLGAP